MRYSSDPPWKQFAHPIGIALAWCIPAVLIIWGGTVLFNSNPIHKQYAAECTAIGGSVEKVEGDKWCVEVEQITEVIPPDDDAYKLACEQAGGADLNRNYLRACYRIDILDMPARSQYEKRDQ
jgi:hypothetical protein